ANRGAARKVAIRKSFVDDRHLRIRVAVLRFKEAAPAQTRAGGGGVIARHEADGRDRGAEDVLWLGGGPIKRGRAFVHFQWKLGSRAHVDHTGNRAYLFHDGAEEGIAAAEVPVAEHGGLERQQLLLSDTEVRIPQVPESLQQQAAAGQ